MRSAQGDWFAEHFIHRDGAAPFRGVFRYELAGLGAKRLGVAEKALIDSLGAVGDDTGAFLFSVAFGRYLLPAELGRGVFFVCVAADLGSAMGLDFRVGLRAGGLRALRFEGTRFVP